MRYYRQMRSGIQAFKRLVLSGKTRIPAMHQDESGSSSAAILVAVVFLAILLFAAVNLVQFVMFNINHFRLQDKLREPLEKEAMKVLELLYKDKTPDAESPLDQVWVYINKNNKNSNVPADKDDTAADPDDKDPTKTGDDDLSPEPTPSSDGSDIEITGEPTVTDPEDPDNPDDPDAVKANPFNIKLEDISSRLNLNWLDSEFIEKLINNTDLKLFKDPKGQELNSSSSTLFAQNFNTFREKAGLTIHPEETYKDWVTEKAFKKGYFTAYSYFNINITNVFVFRHIHKERIGEMGATALENKMKELFTNSTRIEVMEVGSSLNDYTGPKYPLTYALGDSEKHLYPLINALPVMNIHFMKKEFVRKLLLAYELDALKIDQNFLLELYNAKTGKIFKEFSPPDLRTKLFTFLVEPKVAELKIKTRNSQATGYFIFRVMDLFGSYTWFWKLTIKGEAYKDPLSGNTLVPRLTWIIAREPQPNVKIQDPKKLKFKILEKEFTVNKS